VFGLFENFTQIYTNLKEDNYEKNLRIEKDQQATLLGRKRNKAPIKPVQIAQPPIIFATINTANKEAPKYDPVTDNQLKKYVPFLFDIGMEKSLGPLNRTKRYMGNKLIKPAFLKNKSKLKKNKTNNQHILYYDHNVVTISKKVMKYYVDYDRIIIDKKIFDRYIEK
jgi:hypothetical protein